MAEPQQHVEVVVELKPGADGAPVAKWLEDRGLATYPLVVGILATGDAEAFRAAFEAEPSGVLPVPRELAQHVDSIAVAPPKRLHEGR